jgi:hypothetical protein
MKCSVCSVTGRSLESLARRSAQSSSSRLSDIPIDLIFEASSLSTTVNQGLHKLDTGCSHDGHASSARAKRDPDFPPADSCYFSPTTRARSCSLWELSIRDWQCCRSQIREPRPSRPYNYPNSRGQSWNTVPDIAWIFRCP